MDESYPYRTLSVKTALSPDKPSKNPDLSVKKPHFTDKPSGIPDLSVNTYHSPDKSPESPDPSVEARRFPDKTAGSIGRRPAENLLIGRKAGRKPPHWPQGLTAAACPPDSRIPAINSLAYSEIISTFAATNVERFACLQPH